MEKGAGRYGVIIVLWKASPLHGNREVTILSGIRLSKRGYGLRGFPGGTSEDFDGSPQDTAIREGLQELGITIDPDLLTLIGQVINQDDDRPPLLVHILAYPFNPNQIVVNGEPDKCAGWEQFSLSETTRMAQGGLFLPSHQDALGVFKNYLSALG